MVIKESLSSSSKSLQEIVDYLLQARGKQLRPLLVIISAGLVDENLDEHRRSELFKVAAAVELIHSASLLHDEIIDGATHRRGIEALHRRWGNEQATLVGDYLLSQAFDLLSGLEQNEVLLPILAHGVFLMCRGEVLQLSRSFHWEMGEQEYFRCNYLKTSQFLAVCCEAGGRIARASVSQIRSLREYGFNLGQAFQIADDILDYAEQPEKLGKSTGIDLSHGVITLPLIYMLQKNRRYRSFLQSVLSRRESLTCEIQRSLCREIMASGALEYSFLKAEGSIEAALSALKIFPSKSAQQLLRQIAEAVTEKVSFVLGQNKADLLARDP